MANVHVMEKYDPFNLKLTQINSEKNLPQTDWSAVVRCELRQHLPKHEFSTAADSTDFRSKLILQMTTQLTRLSVKSNFIVPPYKLPSGLGLPVGSHMFGVNYLRVKLHSSLPPPTGCPGVYLLSVSVCQTLYFYVCLLHPD